MQLMGDFARMGQCNLITNDPSISVSASRNIPDVLGNIDVILSDKTGKSEPETLSLSLSLSLSPPPLVSDIVFRHAYSEQAEVSEVADEGRNFVRSKGHGIPTPFGDAYGITE